MGNTSSNYQDLVKTYKPADWCKIQDQGNYQVWENLIQKRKFDVYPMPTELHKDIQELQKYQFRKIHHSRLVAPSFILKSENSYLCSGPYSSLVAMEHIKYRLSQIPRKLTLLESLSVLSHSAAGFNIVTSFFGQIQPNDDLICFNEAGTCKVWINQNLSNNFPSINNEIIQVNSKNQKNYSNSMNHLLNSTKNIQTLIKEVQKHSTVSYNFDLKRELNSCQNNADLINCIQNYCLTYKMQILDRINFDTLEEKSQINKIKILPINYSSNASNKVANAHINQNQPQIIYARQFFPPLQFSNTNISKNAKNVILPNVINTNSRHYIMNPVIEQSHNVYLQSQMNLVRSDHSKDILISKDQKKYQSQNGENKIVIRYSPKVTQIVRMPIYNNYLTTQNSPVTNRNPLTSSHSQKQFTLSAHKITNINQNQVIRDSQSSYNHPIHNYFPLQNKQQKEQQLNHQQEQNEMEIQKRRVDRSQTFINKLTTLQQKKLDKEIQKNQIKRKLKIDQKQSLQYMQKQFDNHNSLINMQRQEDQKHLKDNNHQIQSQKSSQNEQNANFRSQDLRYTQTKLSQQKDSQFVSQSDEEFNDDYQVQHIESQQMMDRQMRVSENTDIKNYIQNAYEVQKNNQKQQSEDLVKIQTEQVEASQKSQKKNIHQNIDGQDISSIQTQSILKKQNLNLQINKEKEQSTQNMRVNLKQNFEQISSKQNQDRYIESQRLNSMDYDDIEAYVKKKYHDYLNKDKKQLVVSSSYKNYPTQYKYVSKVQNKPVEPYRQSYRQPYRSSFLQNEQINIPKLQIKKIISTTHNYSKIQNTLKNNHNFEKLSDKLILDTYELDSNPLKFEEKKPIRDHKRNSSRTSYLEKTKEFDKIQEKYNKYVRKQVKENQQQIEQVYSSRDVRSYGSKTNRITQNQQNIESLSRISSKPAIQKNKAQVMDVSKQKKISYSTLRQLLWN